MNEVSKFHTVRGYQLMEQNKKLLTSAMEDYLEMIYRYTLKQEYLRMNTLSELLNVSAPSTTTMVQKLYRLGMLEYKKHGMIFLTESGKDIGYYLLQRHEIIELFLKNLGVNENTLTETELIEHYISATTLQKLSIFNKFIKQNPDIIQRYEQFSQYNIS